ncbi:MAG: ubiquinol-cytochrome c reductase iron-sulfur subunit [Acidobacteriota bacterium]
MTILSEERGPAAQETKTAALPISPRVRPPTQDTMQRANFSRLPRYPASRRQFLRAGIAAFGALALWIMDRLARRAELIPEESETVLTVPWNAAQEVHFYDSMIVVNHPSDVAVFSSRCSHLGCRIDRTEGQELVCPCHGSRYDRRGNVVRGPATRSLRALPLSLDRTRSLLSVTIGSPEA